MFGLLGLLPGLFGTINGITKAISDERIKRIQAKTEEERIASDERVKTLEARRAIVLAKSGQWETRALMFALGVGPAFILNKIYIWDKALGDWTGGHTDKLDDNLWWVIIAQIGFYFLASVIRK
jgi:hypothetical protein